VTLVVDASFAVAAFSDSGETGAWARQLIAGEDVAAPQLVLVEAANMLRGAVRVRQLSEDSASLAYADLLTLRVELFGYYPLARRIWELRGNVTAYDAWYVALAEALDSPLATLDARLARAPGPQCQFLLFED
jgi:predicted nucleic acid-binding protein